MDKFLKGYIPNVSEKGIEIWLNDIYEVWVYKKN